MMSLIDLPIMLWQQSPFDGHEWRASYCTSRMWHRQCKFPLLYNNKIPVWYSLHKIGNMHRTKLFVEPRKKNLEVWWQNGVKGRNPPANSLIKWSQVYRNILKTARSKICRTNKTTNQWVRMFPSTKTVLQ